MSSTNIELNSLKRKVFFEDNVLNNKNIKLEKTLNDEQDEDSVTLELDVTIGAPLLKQMYQPIVSNYIQFYDSKKLRSIIIKSPKLAIQLFGKSRVDYVVSLLNYEQYHKFLRNCTHDKRRAGLSQVLGNIEHSDKQLFDIAIHNYTHLLPKISVDPKIWKFLPPNLPIYHQIFAQTLKLNPSLIKSAPKEVRDKYLNKELALEFVKTTDWALFYLPHEFRKDREIVLEAVKRDGTSLEFAADEFKSDEEIVMAALAENGASLSFASDEFKNQKSLKLQAINNWEKSFYNWKDEASDRDVSLQALRKWPQYFSEMTHLHSDREIVFEFVKKQGSLFCYASNELKSDRELVLLAIESGDFKFNHFPYQFHSDKEIILRAIKKNPLLFKDIPKEMKLDKEIALVAAKSRIPYEQLPNEMLNEKEILLEVLKNERKPRILLKYLMDNLEHKDWIDWVIEFLK